MAWVYLVVAGLLEIGWPLGLKKGWSDAGVQWTWLNFAILCMALSGGFLLAAQRTVPMGTAYAVWTGIGAVGTFLVGIALFREPPTVARFVCVGLVAMGIVGLKLFGEH